jgi:hypothetical protein
LLAASRDGCTEAIMLAHGFTGETTAALIRGGLALATTERMRAGNRAIEVTRVRITDAGRRALEEKWLAARNEAQRRQSCARSVLFQSVL